MALSVSRMCQDIADLQVHGDGTVQVARVTADSRQAGPDALFVAVRGTSGDGHRYLTQVKEAGCRAVAVEDNTEAAGFAVVVTAPSTRSLPALLARNLEGVPDRRLLTAGVTGTNGKTTVAFLMRQLLGQLRGPCGLLGTIYYDDGQKVLPAPLTTPGGPVFYHWLGRMESGGCRSVAMEISSHALDQGRTAGLGLDVAIMTNLGRDHLDYHQDMASYLEAKAGIIALLRPAGEGPREQAGTLVLNADDEHLCGLDRGQVPVLRFSARVGSKAAADLRVVRADLDLTGSRLGLEFQGQEMALESGLVGRYNVENLTAAVGAALALGFAPEAIVTALRGIEQVPGRLERIVLPHGGIAVVDYAHTHDALAAVLQACDELVAARLLVVFGCGGDRDRGKRPLMGEVAARQADRVWITSDNPRGEDPAAICQEIAAGYTAVKDPRSAGHAIVVDRTAGIEAALESSAAGDIVVIAGKGHEDYQWIGDQRLDLDDREIVRAWASRQEGHV